jgi:hypothetical protein
MHRTFDPSCGTRPAAASRADWARPGPTCSGALWRARGVDTPFTDGESVPTCVQMDREYWPGRESRTTMSAAQPPRKAVQPLGGMRFQTVRLVIWMAHLAPLAAAPPVIAGDTEDAVLLGPEHWRPTDSGRDRAPRRSTTVIAEVEAFGDRPGFRGTWRAPRAGDYTMTLKADSSFDLGVFHKSTGRAICRGEHREISCPLGELVHGESFEIHASHYIGYGPGRNLRVSVEGPAASTGSRAWHDRRNRLVAPSRPATFGLRLGLEIPSVIIDREVRGGVGFATGLELITGYLYFPFRLRYLALDPLTEDAIADRDFDPEQAHFNRTALAADLGAGLDLPLGTFSASLRVDGFVSVQSWWVAALPDRRGAWTAGVTTALLLSRFWNFSMRFERFLGEAALEEPAGWMVSLGLSMGAERPHPGEVR